MSFRIMRASTADVLDVFRALAPERAAEATASSWHDDPMHTAHELLIYRQGAPAGHVELWALCDDERPVAICGYVQGGPGRASMVWIATARFRDVKIAAHRWWRAFFVPLVLHKFRRVEFLSLAADQASRRWLAYVGFTEEGLVYRHGKRGEDFVRFAWLNPDGAVPKEPHV